MCVEFDQIANENCVFYHYHDCRWNRILGITVTLYILLQYYYSQYRCRQILFLYDKLNCAIFFLHFQMNVHISHSIDALNRFKIYFIDFQFHWIEFLYKYFIFLLDFIIFFFLFVMYYIIHITHINKKFMVINSLWTRYQYEWSDK